MERLTRDPPFVLFFFFFLEKRLVRGRLIESYDIPKVNSDIPKVNYDIPNINGKF